MLTFIIIVLLVAVSILVISLFDQNEAKKDLMTQVDNLLTVNARNRVDYQKLEGEHAELASELRTALDTIENQSEQIFALEHENSALKAVLS